MGTGSQPYSLSKDEEGDLFVDLGLFGTLITLPAMYAKTVSSAIVARSLLLFSLNFQASAPHFSPLALFSKQSCGRAEKKVGAYSVETPLITLCGTFLTSRTPLVQGKIWVLSALISKCFERFTEK